MPDFNQFELADFAHPPVVETVLSIQFEKINSMRSVHLGLFWRKMKKQFPKIDERPALLQMFELFPEPFPRGNRFRFEAAEPPALSRLWLLNEAGTEMIQIQDDRFIKNWRKIGEMDQYPHYEPVIKPAFERDFHEFQSFAAEEGLGPLKVTQCEVTYVNHIVGGEGWNNLGDLDQVFTFWNLPMTPAAGKPEDLALHVRFPITDDQSRPIGRLHVDIQPALRAIDNRPMYVLNLTARGQYGAGFEFFDIGRKWIVKSFEQLTTEKMHKIWGKK